MEFTSVDTLDHAKALVDCVYSVYGLTFHREYVYYPERLLELNRRAHLRSFIALDGGRVVGHLAWIRPFFELQRNGEPLSDDRIGEVGLSIVRPEYRSQHVQTYLAMAMTGWVRERGGVGGFMKCVTHHLYSQRTAARLGGKPLTFFLAGVPKWVVYDDAPGERRDPISTILFYTPVRPLETAPVRVPTATPWLGELVRSSGLLRQFADDGALEDGPTDLEIEFAPGKHIAQVHVLHAGADVFDRIAAESAWLLRGHMKHVSFFLPASSARLQRGAGALLEQGLIPGGFIPGLHAGGRDVFVWQAIKYDDLDVGALQVHGSDGEWLKQRVAEAWQARPVVDRP